LPAELQLLLSWATTIIQYDLCTASVTPHDLVATLYSLLGIPPETELHDAQGRPVRVGGPGQVIQGVMA